MGKPSAPEPIDPIEAGRAQTGTNIGTAIANAYLANPNQITPEGTLSTTQTGTYQYTDPVTGDTYDIPLFTTETAYSGANQDLYDIGMDTKLGMANFANEQVDRLSAYFNEPINLDNDAVESRIMELARTRMDPMLADRRSALETRLSEQGIMRGSEAYDRAMGELGQTENDAYTNLLLTGRQQAINEALLARNQPLNELTALMTGSQVSNPTYGGGNMPTVPTTPISDFMYSSKDQEYNAWQQEMANRTAMFDTIGGLFAPISFG
jgi:hypothetical protein